MKNVKGNRGSMSILGQTRHSCDYATRHKQSCHRELLRDREGAGLIELPSHFFEARQCRKERKCVNHVTDYDPTRDILSGNRNNTYQSSSLFDNRKLENFHE